MTAGDRGVAVVAVVAGASRTSAARSPSDVADAVAFVLDHPARGCSTEIRLQPFAEG